VAATAIFPCLGRKYEAQYCGALLCLVENFVPFLASGAFSYWNGRFVVRSI
jgi:hypothetical protein